MREITTKQGDTFLVDDNWYQLLGQYQWSTRIAGGLKYAYTYKGHPLKSKGVAMHRIITSCPTGMLVDHVNEDTLDNRSANLRLATKGQNNINRTKLPRNNKSGVTGVYEAKTFNGWVARIQVGGVGKHLGCFRTREDAIAARRKAEVEYFGEYSPTVRMV